MNEILKTRKRVGLILVAAGVAVWLLPFMLIGADNALGVTKPADTIIGTFGLTIIVIAPVLIILGLILAFVKKPQRR